MFNRFIVINKSINFAADLSKWPSKNKGPTRAHAKSQLRGNLTQSQEIAESNPRVPIAQVFEE